jgi:hypothetical protein
MKFDFKILVRTLYWAELEWEDKECTQNTYWGTLGKSSIGKIERGNPV